MPITRYDRSPMEQAILERDRFQEEALRLKKELVDALDYRAGEFARHKEALEKAMVALDPIECVCIVPRIAMCPRCIAMEAINDLLDKKGDK